MRLVFQTSDAKTLPEKFNTNSVTLIKVLIINLKYTLNVFLLFMFAGQTAEGREIQRQNYHHTPN
jgi:hypothetical protein